MMLKEVYKKYGIESVILMCIFIATWLGFGNYTAGVGLLVFIFALFFQKKREFLAKSLRDKWYILFISLFTLNNLISSFFSIEKFESAVLSIVFFLIIFIPMAYVRFSLNKDNDFFVGWIVPAGFLISTVILLYLFASFSHTFFTEGFVIKRYTFRFMGKASTPDFIVMLGGIGYGWIRQKEEPRYCWLGLLYLLICMLGMALTYDRGGVISLFIVSVILLSFDYKRLIVLLIIMAILIVSTFVFEPFERFKNLFSFLYSGIAQARLMSHTQLATFKGAWEMIKDHWLLGVGTGNFHAFIKQYGTGRWYTYAHNFILQFWAENGLFGMIFGLSIIGLILFRWAKSWKLYKYKYIALGLGVSFIGMLVGNLTNSTIWMIKIALPFWLLAGVLNAIYYIVKNQTDDFLKKGSMDEI
jgi:O-antigen ligase